MTPGPMDFRGPLGFRKAVGFSGPMSSRGGPSKWHWEISMWSLKTFFFFFFFFFGEHLISTGKTVRISVKTFFCFFRRSHHFSDQTDRKSVIFELAPGPLLVPGGTVTIKQKRNFSIINYSFNFYCSLKAKSILEVSKIHEGSLAYCLALNVDIIEVFVLAKSSWQILLVTKTRFQSQHYYLLKTWKHKWRFL